MILACPFCKAKADPAATQCTDCGKTMARACSACAESIAANSTTCKYCGEAVTPAKEPVAAKPPVPGIVFLEEAPRKKRCCAGRTLFWMIAGILAGFAAYSAVKTKIHCHRMEPVKTSAPTPREF